MVISLIFLPFLMYVFFEDRFWSDDASVEKLKIILDAHSEVFDEIKKFIQLENKKVTYVIGNHDAELHK